MMLTKSNICVTHEPAVMTNEWFQSNARKPKRLGSKNDRAKETSAYTPSEERIHSHLSTGKKEDDANDEYVDGNGDDDDAVSINSSFTGNAPCTQIAVINDVDGVPFENLSDEKKMEEKALALKNLGNISRKTQHKHITTNLYFEGCRVLMKAFKNKDAKSLTERKMKMSTFTHGHAVS